MKSFKKIMLVGALLVGLAVQANAAQTTIVLPVGGFSNLLSNFRGSAVVSAVSITSPVGSAGSVKLIDSPTNSLTYVSPAYTGYSSYGTNVITTYTNFFGVVNSFTNVAIVDYTNTVAASTNSYNIPFIGGAATNSTSVYTGVNYYFNNGVWATNTSTAGVTVTVTYQQ